MTIAAVVVVVVVERGNEHVFRRAVSMTCQSYWVRYLARHSDFLTNFLHRYDVILFSTLTFPRQIPWALNYCPTVVPVPTYQPYRSHVSTNYTLTYSNGNSQYLSSAQSPLCPLRFATCPFYCSLKRHICKFLLYTILNVRLLFNVVLFWQHPQNTCNIKRNYLYFSKKKR